MTNRFPLPDYLTKATYRTELERAHAYSTFWIKLAALYNDQSGAVSRLSDCIAKQNGRRLPSVLRSDLIVTPEIAVAIEKAVGRHLMPRELLRPDLFDTQG